MFHLKANQCSYFIQDSRGQLFTERGVEGSNIVIFQGGPDSLPHTPSHHHKHIWISKCQWATYNSHCWKHRKNVDIGIEWKLIENTVHSVLWSSWCVGLLNLFVTKMTNVYSLQIIKLNCEVKVKYADLSFPVCWLSFLRRGQTFWIRRITWTCCDVHAHSHFRTKSNFALCPYFIF